MNIFDIAKTLKQNSAKSKLGVNFDLKKLKISFSSVLWAAFILVFVTELFSLYAHVYKNLVFRLPETEISTAAVRVNFGNYHKVVDRLEEAQSYRATSTINFLGKDQNTGRSNPFDDPE